MVTNAPRRAESVTESLMVPLNVWAPCVVKLKVPDQLP